MTFHVSRFTFHALLSELGHTWRALADRRLLLFMLASVLGIALAYQVKRPIFVDIGGPHDCPYLGTSEYCPQTPGWHDPEGNRWTKASSDFFLPGIGSQPLSVTMRVLGGRPGGDPPPPEITVRINGRDHRWQTDQDFTERTFLVPNTSPTGSSIHLTIFAPVFSTPTDSRELGVNVDWIRVEPADYSPTALVVPSISVTLALLAALLLIYLLAHRTFLNRNSAFAVTVPCLLVILVLLAFRRPEITMFAPQLAVVLLWSCLFALVVRLVAGASREEGGLQPASILAGIFAFAFALRFGGMVYPQFISSDLTFHAHRIDFMLAFLRGEETNFYFDGELPNGTRVPYPSAYYLLLAPFEWLLGGTTEAGKLVLRFASALLDASVVLLLYRFASRLGSVAALSAAFLYAVGPAVFQVFSAGNHTNIFAQAMFVASLVLAVEFLDRGRGSPGYRPLLAGYFLVSVLTPLSHYGMAIIDIGVTLVISVVWLLFSPSPLRGRIWPLLGAFAVALFISYVLYYVHYNAQIGGHIASLLSGGGSRGRSYDLLQLLGDIARWQGLVILPLGLAGILLLGDARRLRSRPINANSPYGDYLYKPQSAQVDFADVARDLSRRASDSRRAILAGWLIACVPVAATALLDRDTLRYNLLALPALCICAGIALQWLAGKFAQRGRLPLGWALTATLLGLAAFYAFLVWGNLIFNQYH